MSTLETYAVRQVGLDPYAQDEDYISRFRSQEGWRTSSWFSPTTSSLGEGQALLYPRAARGGMSNVKSLARSYVKQAEELSEMLKQLQSSEIRVDPYLEIIPESVEGQRGDIVIRVGRQFPKKDNSKQKSRLDEFLRPVTALEKSGHIDAALDVLYDRVDDLLKLKRFATLDALLEEAKVDSLSVDLILGLLTASLPARSKLSARCRFYAEATESIRRRCAWEDGLLAGLE